MGFMWLKRLCFYIAFKGFKLDDEEMKNWVLNSMNNTSIEGELRKELALSLEYFARRINNRL